MKKWPCKTVMQRHRSLSMSLLAVILLIALAAETRGETSPATPTAKREQIHISADRLTADTQNRFAEFSGNVKAIQENAVITSDRLKIYYKQGIDDATTAGTDESAIEKIVASGHVRITFDDKRAETAQAVYITETRMLTLSGPGSTIHSDGNSISGETITYYRTDGRIQVDSGGGKRVEAVLFPGEKGLK